MDDVPYKVRFKDKYFIEVTKKGDSFTVSYPDDPDPDEELESKAQSEDLTEMYPFDNLQPWINACKEANQKPIVNVKFEKWNPTTRRITSSIKEDVNISELVTTIETFFSDMNNVNLNRYTTDLRF